MSETPTQVRRQPCEFCPYREDVPSGVWAAHEYDKLPPYDAPTFDQPTQPFMCHATPDFYCHGWAVCHSNRGHAYELLALRISNWHDTLGIHQQPEIPPPAVPLFESGADAALHGKADILDPGSEAHDAVVKLYTKYPRIREGADERMSEPEATE